MIEDAVQHDALRVAMDFNRAVASLAAGAGISLSEATEIGEAFLSQARELPQRPTGDGLLEWGLRVLEQHRD